MPCAIDRAADHRRAAGKEAGVTPPAPLRLAEIRGNPVPGPTRTRISTRLLRGQVDQPGSHPHTPAMTSLRRHRRRSRPANQQDQLSLSGIGRSPRLRAPTCIGGGMASRELLPAGDSALRGEDGAPSSSSRGGTMHELFASCVARYPHAVALVHHETRLTYSELDALSDHYAVALELAGVGSGDVVPVVMKRSPELVGLLLAVLKRGAAYSPMDPQWPAERLAALVARLRARLVVTGASGPWPVPAWAPPGYDPAAPARRPSPAH